MTRTTSWQLVGLAAALALLNACGLKGDLYLEEEPAEVTGQATDSQATENPATENDEIPAAD